MWSAFILPYMEDKSLKDLMTIGETSAGNFQWAYPGPYTPATLQDPSSKTLWLARPSYRVFAVLQRDYRNINTIFHPIIGTS